MKAASSLTLIVFLLALTGCAPKRYSQFTGRQPWPTSQGAMADNSYVIPVYRGWPDRPYRVIGSIAFANPQHEWKDGDTSHAARIAKSHGGDAMIMRYGGEFGVGAITGAAADARVVSMAAVTALVVKWKTPAEFEAERSALEQFYADYQAKHPNIGASKELLAIGAEYVGSLGIELSSPSWPSKLGETLDQVCVSAGPADSKKWIFRGTLQSGGITTSFTDICYGIARISQSGDSITIVSEAGPASVNFSGVVDRGKLSGQIGISSGQTIFSGKAEGVIAADKLLLNTQGQTGTGTAQGSFTFIH